LSRFSRANLMQYADVLVTIRLAPADAGTATDENPQDASPQSGPEAARVYNALIYTGLAAFRSQIGNAPLQPPPGSPASLRGHPLASIERLRLHWDRYQEYLAQFLVQQKSPIDMSRRLFDAMSPGLERLFSGAVDAGQPIRVWWEAESVELEDFPWELVAYTDKDADEIERFSFVRGLPPETSPALVPMEEGAPLRLAIIAEAAAGPLEKAVDGIPGLKVVSLTGSPRQMLQQVAGSDFELLHIISDGFTSMASDGVLYFHGAPDPELAALELAACLRPSRVVFLGLSSTLILNPDVAQIGGREAPSVYRAFAYFATADLPLPTTLAPLAPADVDAAMRFWRTFYSQLVTTLSIEQAVGAGRKAGPLPVALYLRHPQEQQFRRRSFLEAATSRAAAPSQLGTELEISQRLVGRLKNIKTRSGELLTGVEEFVRKEKAHQEQLLDQLAPWRESDK
jgi:hypothetical protein